MSETEARPVFHLHFEGEETRAHTVSGTALLQAIQGLQRIVQLLGYAHEGNEPKQRVRVSYTHERKYALVFKLPEAGGYDLPYQIGTISSPTPFLFDPTDIESVTQRHSEVLGAISSGDKTAFRKAVPSPSIRRLLVAEFSRMQPPARSGLVLNIENASRQKLFTSTQAVKGLAVIADDEAAPITVKQQTVIGRLDALEFANRTLKLQLPDGRTLSGTYGDNYEPLLLENPREFIQVRGEAVLDDQGRLRELKNIQDIVEIDDSPITLLNFQRDGHEHRAAKPIDFDVKFDPESESYLATGPFHMFCVAASRDELEGELNTTLAFLWNEYVLSPAETLTEDAQALRDELLTAFPE